MNRTGIRNFQKSIKPKCPMRPIGPPKLNPKLPPVPCVRERAAVSSTALARLTGARASRGTDPPRPRWLLPWPQPLPPAGTSPGDSSPPLPRPLPVVTLFLSDLHVTVGA